MVHNDLRDWIDDLEERNDLKRITAEVDWNEEIGAITREISSQFGPALLFEKYQRTSPDSVPPPIHQWYRNEGTGVPFARCFRKNLVP